jgi:hypothetical protein
MKREDTEVVEPKSKAAEQVENAVSPITVPAPAAQRSGRVSKTSTPVAGTFPETSARGASRASRTKEAVAGSGSHASSESGQNERTQREKRKRVSSRKVDHEDEVDAEDAEDEEEPVDPNEPLYCYCNDVSYGEMVACDNNKCEKQWFHLQCVGLDKPPSSAKWYCNDCKPAMKESRRVRGN